MLLSRETSSGLRITGTHTHTHTHARAHTHTHTHTCTCVYYFTMATTILTTFFLGSDRVITKMYYTLVKAPLTAQ